MSTPARMARQIASLKKKLAEAKAEITGLKIRLKNAELMYHFEVKQYESKKKASKDIERN